MAERVRFYCDAQVAHRVAEALRRYGADALTAVDAGLADASDVEHLRLAYQQARVILTQDADFLRLAAGGEPHAGILYAAMHTPDRRIMHKAAELFYAESSASMMNRVVFV